MRLLGLILMVLLLSACAFNKLYLRPSALSSDTQLLKQVRNKDTVYISFNPVNHQPTYLKGKTDRIEVEKRILEADLINNTNLIAQKQHH